MLKGNFYKLDKVSLQNDILEIDFNENDAFIVPVLIAWVFNVAR